jgi:hypothetical protein
VQYTLLRKKLLPAWYWMVGNIGVGFVSFAFFHVFSPTISSYEEYKILSALSAAMGGIILWDVLRRQVQEKWLTLLAGPVAMIVPIILSPFPNLILGDLYAELFENPFSGVVLGMVQAAGIPAGWVLYSLYRGFAVGMVQALCLIRLHRRERSPNEDQKFVLPSVGNSLLRVLVGAVLSALLVLAVIIGVNLIEGSSWFDEEETTLVVLFGGALPGAIIGLFGSLLRRISHLYIYSGMVMAIDAVIIVDAMGDREKAPLALLLGVPVGIIIAALHKTTATRWLKSKSKE